MTKIETYGAILFVLIVGLFAAGAAFAGATTVYSNTDDVTVDYSTDVEVTPERNATSFLDNETVTNSTGAQLVEGTDYDWNTSTGAITFYNTTATTDGNTATASYEYNAYSDRTLAMKGVISTLFRLLAAASLLGGGLVVARWTGWIGGAGR